MANLSEKAWNGDVQRYFTKVLNNNKQYNTKSVVLHLKDMHA